MLEDAVAHSKTTTKRRHLLIAGTGRAGTSALVRLLSACGLDTVLDNGEKGRWATEANAGAESLVLHEAHSPYVIKSPWAYQYIDDLLDDPTIALDGVIIPIRRLARAAESRIVTELTALNARDPTLLNYKRPWSEIGHTDGGTLNSLEPLDQQRILGRSLHMLIEALEERSIKFTFLYFPRYVQDADYTWAKIGEYIPGLQRPAFDEAFGRVISSRDVRIEGEVDEARSYAPPERDQTSSATLADLRVASLLREIRSLKEQLKQIQSNQDGSSKNPRCTDPDQAPDGMSHGDANIGTEGLMGWHWTTFRRPENRSYGYQTAHSDTVELSKIRRLIDGSWTAWRVVG
jgi:hypothetical protein